MTRTLNRLTALKVARATKPGLYADGGGLYLQVTSSGARSWLFRFSLNGKARAMGLGSTNAVSLSDARLQAADCRRQRQEGIDPIEARKALRERAVLDAAKSITFKEAAAKYIAVRRVKEKWRSAKHAAQWESSLAIHAYPIIGNISVQAINTVLVEKVLEPVWRDTPETASRVRSRIELILNWAKAHNLRQGENPARWRGHLGEMDFPSPSKDKHHAALPYDDLPGFMAALREQEGAAARALEFLILTAARAGEVLGATDDEINSAEVWTIPAERMKGGKKHRVPLSACAVAIVNECRSGGYVFSRRKHGKPLSALAMAYVLKRMNADRTARGLVRYVDPEQGKRDITTHGFRSTFTDWVRNRTNYPEEMRKVALAHRLDDKTDAAYARSDMIEKRRRLMDEWATFCRTTESAAGGNVVALHSGR
jgi:integrase